MYHFYLRPAIAGYCLFQGLNTEGRIKRIGEPPGQYLPTCPVHDGNEIAEALMHGNVGDVGTPDVIGLGNVESPEKVGIDRMSWMGL